MRAELYSGRLSALGQPALQLSDTVITGTGMEVAALMSSGSITRIVV